ncbi:MAG: hypothetical protein ACHBN1_08790 [Heteroscytonema crispum UTEX LB 1556]
MPRNLMSIANSLNLASAIELIEVVVWDIIICCINSYLEKSDRPKKSVLAVRS